MCLLDVRPVDVTPAAARGLVRLRRAVTGGGVEPVGRCHDGEGQPDTGTDHSTNGHRSAVTEVVVAGDVAVDWQSYQREHAHQPHAVVDGVGQLAGEVAERPVRRVGVPAEQRQRGDEADVGQRQVADVVVRDGLVAQLAVRDDDVEDQRVTADADSERQQVRHDESGHRRDRIQVRWMMSTEGQITQQVRHENSDTRDGRNGILENKLCAAN